MERILEESGSECDKVFSESENSSESESEENADESAVEILDNGDDTVPPAPKITKKEGWKWSVTGDKPSKYHFTGNSGIKPAIIRNLPPKPNPLDVFQFMVHDSLWDEIATETNRFAVQYHGKNPNSPTRSQLFPKTSQEMKACFALCVLMAQVKKPSLQSYWSIRKSLHTPFFSEVIPLKRCVLLSKFLHLTNNENISRKRSSLEIRTSFESLETKFQRSILSPGECSN
jgi:hypothetical protein